MQTQIFPTYDILCKNVAEKIVESVNKKQNALICLGSGDTPLGVFEYLIKMNGAGKVDFSKTHFVGLDEWLGMDENDEGSCFYTMHQHLFNPLKLEASQIHCFNAKSNDLENECKKIDDLIAENNGLDLVLLGIGKNGHLAMNEPGTPLDISCHISKLAESTISTGQKYFKSETPLQLGITVGLKHIAETKEIILMANGLKKAEIIYKTIHSKPDISVPSSILKISDNVSVMLDNEAGSLIKNNH